MYTIDENDEGMTIEIKTQGEQQQLLMRQFQDCQNGQCACPTDEYKKLESMELTKTEDGIQIDLIALPHEKISKEEVSRCLENAAQVD